MSEIRADERLKGFALQVVHHEAARTPVSAIHESKNLVLVVVAAPALTPCGLIVLSSPMKVSSISTMPPSADRNCSSWNCPWTKLCSRGNGECWLYRLITGHPSPPRYAAHRTYAAA